MYYKVVYMRKRLGEFEFQVLSAILRLKDGAYGVTVRQEIERQFGKEIAIGAVYTTLRRLEAKQFISSKFGAPVAERGGRSKRFYRLEADGRLALERSVADMSRAISGILST